MSDLPRTLPESRLTPWKAIFRALFSVALLAIVILFVDEEILFERISALDAVWVGVALLATLPQYFLSAARWRLTAERLGAILSFRTALSEYYLAVLTNQILPGGVLGDAARAFRHGRRLSGHDAPRSYGPAVRAVIFERASGQLVLFLVMLSGLFFWPARQGETPLFGIVGMALLIVLIAGGAMFFLFRGYLAKSRLGSGAGGLLREAQHALFARDVLPLQALYSLSVLATYLFCFYCAGRAIGITMSFAEVVALVPAILFSMTLPITIAGWGIREASAAAIWGLANLTPADGVAISVTYGIIVLLSALPGILFVIPRSRKGDVGDKR